MVVDKNGFLLAVMVTIACVHDSKAAYLLARYLRELCCKIKVILADAGYRGEIADRIKTTFGYILEVVVSGDKVNGFKPIGKRWIVERTFACLLSQKYYEVHPNDTPNRYFRRKHHEPLCR